VDEYQLEIQAIRSTLTRLRADEADPELIEEYEAEVRILVALYTAATESLDAGLADPRLRTVLAELGFGEWNMQNVYSFVYDAALGAQAVFLALAVARPGLPRYYALITWATVVALWNYLRRGVPATWDAAEGTR